MKVSPLMEQEIKTPSSYYDDSHLRAASSWHTAHPLSEHALGNDSAQMVPGQNALQKARGDWREQMARLRHNETRETKAAMPVAPEITKLVLKLARRSEELSFTSIQERVLRKFDRKLSLATVTGILTRHGVRRCMENARMPLLESRILAGELVQPRLLARALRLNLALQEHGTPGEGQGRGEVLAQTMFPVLPGAWGEEGKWQVHVVVDTWGVVAFADLRPEAGLEDAVDLLHGRVLPWYAERGERVHCIQTSRSRMFAGDADHVYETYLRMQGIEHRVRPLKAPALNGYMARFKQALTNDVLLPLREDLREEREEMAGDGEKSCLGAESSVRASSISFNYVRTKLIRWVRHYNWTYPMEGYRNEGRPPLTFWRSKGLCHPGRPRLAANGKR